MSEAIVRKCVKCGEPMTNETLEWKCPKCGHIECIEPEYCPPKTCTFGYSYTEMILESWEDSEDELARKVEKTTVI